MSQSDDDAAVYSAISRTQQDDRMKALEKRLDLFERVMRRFVEHPMIYAAGSFRPLVEEMGYEYSEDGHGIRRKA